MTTAHSTNCLMLQVPRLYYELEFLCTEHMVVSTKHYWDGHSQWYSWAIQDDDLNHFNSVLSFVFTEYCSLQCILLSLDLSLYRSISANKGNLNDVPDFKKSLNWTGWFKKVGFHSENDMWQCTWMTERAKWDWYSSMCRVWAHRLSSSSRTWISSVVTFSWKSQHIIKKCQPSRHCKNSRAKVRFLTLTILMQSCSSLSTVSWGRMGSSEL